MGVACGRAHAGASAGRGRRTGRNRSRVCACQAVTCPEGRRGAVEEARQVDRG